MNGTLLAVLAVTALLGGCDKPSTGSKPAELTPATSRDAPSPKASRMDAATTATQPIHVAQRCAVDDDCIALREVYIDKSIGSCCRSCNTQPLARSWSIQAQRDCDEMGSMGCPSKKCAPLEPVACVDGKCSIAKSAAPRSR